MTRWLWWMGVMGCGDGPGRPEPTGEGDGGPNETGCIALADGSCVTETFQNPPVSVPDADGVHRLTLAATEVVIEGQRHCVRAYNGAVPGPTLVTEARQGDEQRSVRVDLVNGMLDHDYRDLENRDCACTDSMGQECLPEHIHDVCASEVDQDCICRADDGEICDMFDFNTTNLHAHGSHVPPDYARGGAACEPAVIDGIIAECRDCDDEICDGSTDDACYNGDNVLNAVHPATGSRYRYDIDQDGTHHTGLQWYHPHIHGTSAIQVASGAAGTWIVRGELDALPGIVDARERVMIFNTPPVGANGFVPLEDGVECTDETLTFNNFYVLPDADARGLNVINWQRRPRMLTAPGQVERWRMVHAGYLDEVFFALLRGNDSDCESYDTGDAMPISQIGRDGLVLPEPYVDDQLFLSPGYRIEMLLGGEGQLADGETWCLVAARFLQDGSGDREDFAGEVHSPLVPPTREQVVAQLGSAGDVVAILNVSAAYGEPTTTTLPDPAAVAAQAPPFDLGGQSVDEACAAAQAVEDPAEIEQVSVIQVGFNTLKEPDPCDCPVYNINCNNFETTDRERYPFDRDLMLGEVETWRVKASFDGHPFHIHINPFVMCPAPSVFDPIPFAHWRDTALINFGRKHDLLSYNRAFTGPYVLHCHKLTHEDHGMMEKIRVCDPATDPTCGDYGWRDCDADDLVCLQALASTECHLLADDEIERNACVATLAAGICAPDACAADTDCDDDDVCVENHCVQPSVCVPPCGPGTTCVDGTCQ